ncbi:hypothetical protein PVAP13_3NG179214 [Panicum virgatum]|uniref:Uncharacterized protein n=1 Tax=Panicum virgatum TaxID=38727 RepID=A0A8T0U2P3_PANVG|nr:hypothetical protein PVAP13_3NG179214 [Panicum virgatum]
MPLVGAPPELRSPPLCPNRAPPGGGGRRCSHPSGCFHPRNWRAPGTPPHPQAHRTAHSTKQRTDAMEFEWREEEDEQRCRAQCGSSTAAIFHHPDRPHDLVFNDPRDRLPITPPPDRLTISSTTVHAHTRAHPRSHARHGLARAQPSVLDAHTRIGHTRRPRAQSTRSAHTHHALARTHAARHEHTHTLSP